MPKVLEAKLKKEYPHNDHAVYGTLNKLGMMKGSKETKKGKLAEKKHEMAKKMHPARQFQADALRKELEHFK